MTQNRLTQGAIQLLRREREMESFLYDGSYTAQCELEDVRPGDRIEFAFTVVGANPVKKGQYSDYFSTQWSAPVERQITRFLYSAGRKIRFHPISRKMQPTIKTEHGITEWLCDETAILERRLDDDAPADHRPRGSLQATEFQNWGEMVEWGRKLFSSDTPVSKDVQAEIEKLRAIAGCEARILAALRMVQEEIRYLGIDAGIGSHQPTAPNEVFRRRFGDCKDKALLLCTLLRQSGIDAPPALVSASYRGAIADRLPAPDYFDHVIVQVLLDGAAHWLDATRTQQRGPLAQIYIGQFKKALVLREGNHELTDCAPPPGSYARTKVVEHYYIPAPGGAAELNVVTEYRGRAADSLRAGFQDSNADEKEKEYLKYYARRFPAIETRERLAVREMEAENGCTVEEFYRIPNVWTLNEERKKYELSLYPEDLSQEMGTAGTSQRLDPLERKFPDYFTQEIHAEMFEDWPLTEKKEEVKNSFFSYQEEATGKGRELIFRYSFESLSDRILPGELAKYNEALNKLKDTLGYNLSYKTPTQMSAARPPTHFNWPVVAFGAVVLITGVIAAVLFFWFTKLSVPRPTPGPTRLEGLGGWLALVALHQIARPLFLVATSFAVWGNILNTETWEALTTPGSAAYHPLWAPTLLFEITYNCLMLVFATLLLFLFFKKRATWPRSYAILLFLTVAGLIFDHYLASQIPAAASESGDSTKSITQVTVAAAIWIPYCFRSERVRATFRF